jgi:hypothetical protein
LGEYVGDDTPPCCDTLTDYAHAADVFPWRIQLPSA